MFIDFIVLCRANDIQLNGRQLIWLIIEINRPSINHARLERGGGVIKNHETS